MQPYILDNDGATSVAVHDTRWLNRTTRFQGCRFFTFFFFFLTVTHPFLFSNLVCRSNLLPHIGASVHPTHVVQPDTITGKPSSQTSSIRAISTQSITIAHFAQSGLKTANCSMNKRGQMHAHIKQMAWQSACSCGKRPTCFHFSWNGNNVD